MITLTNAFITARISPRGAEIQSLSSKETGIEYMWSGDAQYWGKHSPVLFPIVGGLKDDTYYYQGKAYKLPRHGFAREREFAVTQISATEAVFTLTNDAQTAAVYPFAFELQLRYRLQNATLYCSYEVYNPGDTELLFSVGGHPAFAVPYKGNSSYSDHYLRFNVTEPLQRWKLENGLVANHAEPLETDDNILPLHAALFYEDAIVLKHIRSNSISLGCTKNAHGLHFSFEDFPFFGIWAAKDAPFVCLEPWCGIADSVDTDQQLINKEGMNRLEARGRWRREWGVEAW
ncbi:aldose 1-epimerase family protein [Ferruginibacter sp.]